MKIKNKEIAGRLRPSLWLKGARWISARTKRDDRAKLRRVLTIAAALCCNRSLSPNTISVSQASTGMMMP
ncbi:hypothetical protein [Paenibacillus lautus]|uniref:hypothetical protein n=1 Tax=Paenibacillus lautus TaxID=1401 RepID=UPI003D2B4C47